MNTGLKMTALKVSTNALSDIYAMGGTVKTALNIVCFPEKMDLSILGKIMQGGADKVIEAGSTLAGGHSIADRDVYKRQCNRWTDTGGNCAFGDK